MIDFAASRYEQSSMERFRELYIRTAQALVTHNSQSDVTVGELRHKLNDKKNFFESIRGFFRKKR